MCECSCNVHVIMSADMWNILISAINWYIINTLILCSSHTWTVPQVPLLSLLLSCFLFTLSLSNKHKDCRRKHIDSGCAVEKLIHVLFKLAPLPDGAEDPKILYFSSFFSPSLIKTPSPYDVLINTELNFLFPIKKCQILKWACLSLQYWYEGDEAGDLPVDFSIVWDGDFFIDKPTSMKGKTCLSSAQSTSLKVSQRFPSWWNERPRLLSKTHRHPLVFCINLWVCVVVGAWSSCSQLSHCRS